MNPEDRSHQGESIRSTPLPEDITDTDYSASSSSSPEISNNNTLHSQKETNEPIIKQLPATSTMDENQEELQLSIKEVDTTESIMRALISCIILSTFVLILFLWVPIKVFGMSVYAIILFCHSLLFSSLFFIHYILLPSVIEERYAASCKINGQRHYDPVYRPTKNELSWVYLRMLLYYSTNAGIWKCISCMDPHRDVKDKDESLRKASTFSFFGMLLLFASLYVLVFLGPLYSEYEVKAEASKELYKLRDRILEKDNSYSTSNRENENILVELLEEKDKENERLRRENEELNSKIL
ncbi:hypothetical protein MOSE0_N00122 [Monosporozyma servazzii]